MSVPRQVVFHGCGVAECSIPLDENVSNNWYALLVDVESILKLLRSEDEDHMFGVIIIEKIV
jgi:hypothetical protein